MSDVIKDRRLINLSSQDATNIYNEIPSFKSSVDFFFKSILKLEDDIVSLEGAVLQAAIPVSFYTINYTNDTLYYDISGLTKIITITRGNYNFTTLANEMIAKFLINGDVFAIIISEITGILKFTYTPVMGSTFDSFNFTGSTILSVLGCITTSNTLAIANVLTPLYPLNLLGITKLKIFSNYFATSGHDSTGLSTSNLIATIGVNQPSFGIIIYDNQEGAYGKLKNNDISLIDIQITDQNNQLINFNNIDWSITLTLIIYRKIEVKNQDLTAILEEIKNENINLNAILGVQEPQPTIEEPIQENIQTNDSGFSQNPLVQSNDLSQLNFLQGV